MTHATKLQRIAARAARVAPMYVLEYRQRPEFVTDFMERNAEHVILSGVVAYRQRHAPKQRFSRWQRTRAYAAALLLQGLRGAS